MQTQSDRVLCGLALRGNAGAYEALYNRHHNALYGFVYHLLGRGATAEDSEDIAQEAFGTAFSKLGERRDEASFKSWLFTIARNRAFDQLRARRPVAADVTELTLVSETGTEGDAERKAHLVWLMDALAGLPERQREALVMREMGGLSYNQIATDLRTTVPGVKQLINRARGSLTDAAEGADYRPRRLSKELGALVPALPLAGGAGLTAFGIGGSAVASATGFGGASAAVKIAAVVLALAAVGGGGAGIQTVAGGDDFATTGRSALNAAAAQRARAAAGTPAGGRTAGQGDRSASNLASGGDGGERSASGTDGSGNSDALSRDGSVNDAKPHEQDTGKSADDATDTSSSDAQASPDAVEAHAPESASGGGDSTGSEPHTEGGDSLLPVPDSGG
jgi:RNA polymerase sigma factor (sigma-70 family)